MARKSNGEGFGVFEKDGKQIVAWSAEDAVRFRWEGYEEKAPAAPENREPDPQPEADAPASA